VIIVVATTREQGEYECKSPERHCRIVIETWAVSDVTSGVWYWQQGYNEVTRKPDKLGAMRTLITTLALVLVAAAIAAPAALARTDAPSFDISGSASTPGTAPSVVRVVDVPTDSGFDWGDAAIGAGAAVALGMIAAGGAIATVNLRRSHRHGTPSAP